MSMLTGPRIKELVASGEIQIDPYVSEHVNQSSVDLTLGRKIVEYDFEKIQLRSGSRYKCDWLDAREENPTFTHSIGTSYLLEPNRLYLMHTVERVHTKDYAIFIDGKSSLGRLGLLVHFTAGFVDPGFDGQYTLEMMCVHPLRIYAGMRICQIRFHTLEGEVEDYGERGNYVGERARGPVASQSWRQFK